MEEKKKVGRPKGATQKKADLAKRKNKELVLETLKNTLGILEPALKAASISRSLFYTYYNEDPDFRQTVDDIREAAIDFVEGQLMTQIKNGAAAQTIFFLKTKGKHRGYIETTEQNMTIDAIKIKYIVPQEDNKFLEDKPIMPLDNPTIKLELPE